MTMYSPKIKDDLIPQLYKMSKSAKKPMTKVVDTILRSYLNGSDLSDSDYCDNMPDLHDREVAVEKRSDGRYSVSVFDPIKDDSLAWGLKRNYELWDFKIFDTKKEADAYASLQKTPAEGPGDGP